MKQVGTLRPVEIVAFVCTINTLSRGMNHTPRIALFVGASVCQSYVLPHLWHMLTHLMRCQMDEGRGWQGLSAKVMKAEIKRSHPEVGGPEGPETSMKYLNCVGSVQYNAVGGCNGINIRDKYQISQGLIKEGICPVWDSLLSVPIWKLFLCFWGILR